MMRRTLRLMVVAVLSAVVALQAQSGQALFEKALAKERVEGNLRQAIGLYERVVREYPADRALAAKALFQIGHCYEKLGKVEARKAYERVLRDFGDQAQAAEARLRLAALDAAAASPAAPTVGTRRIWEGTGIIPELSSVSPDGRYLSFADFAVGNLSLRDLVSGDVRPLTGKHSWNDSKDFADRNAFSRDGKHVAYTWETPTRHELRVVGADGSASRLLFARDDVGFVRPTDWSADNKRVLATLHRKEGNQIATIAVADGSTTIVKTLPPGSPDHTCFVGRGRYVAYDLPASDKQSNRDVYLVAIDGSRDAAIVQNPSEDRLLGCSPDGRQILFMSDRAGSNDAWLLEVDDNGVAVGTARLVKSRVGDRTVPIGFSASGRFLYGQYLTWGDVYTAELDPATRKVIAPATLISESGRFVGSNVSPEWSPDGRFLAYFSGRSEGGALELSPSPSRIIVRAADTGAERAFPQRIYYVHRRLRWSPDGTRLAVSGWDENNHYGIYLIDAQSGEVRRAAESDAVLRYVVWAPRSNALFYVKRNTLVVRKDLDSGEERTIYESPPDKWRPSIRGLAISRDGRSLAWCLEQHDPAPGSTTFISSLVVLPTEGGQPRVVLEEKRAAVQMTPQDWYPDGHAIVVLKSSQGFGSAGSPKSTLWRVPVNGDAPEQMSLGKNVLYQFRFRADGRGVAFDAGEYKAEIWSLDNILPPSKR